VYSAAILYYKGDAAHKGLRESKGEAMSRHLKILGLIAMAVLAIGVISASAASAAPKFTSTGTPTTIHGVQATTNVLTINGGELECESVTFEGTVTGTEAASITVHPTFGGCLAFGRAAEITTTGCNFVLSATGTAEIECEAGKKIIIHVPSGPCTIEFGPQMLGASSVSFTNGGTKGSTTSTVTVTANVTGITYTSTGGACGASGTNGTYTGTVLAKGWTNSAKTTQRGIWWDSV
jgi:hypothetical protein